MGILRGLFEKRSEPVDLANPPAWLIAALGGGETAAGKRVGIEGSLQYIAVYACTRLISTTIASLPLPVYRRLDSGGKMRDPGHPVYSLIHDQPNPEMSAYEFWQAMGGHLCLWGNAFCNIDRDEFARPLALWPLRPDRMTVERSAKSGRLLYRYTLPSGEVRVLLPDEIMYLRGPSGDGVMGYSPLSLARETVGLGLAAEEYAARFFGNGSQPGGVLTTPGKMEPKAFENLKKSWEATHGGLHNSHRVAILEEGVQWQQIGIPPRDAQFLELRQFQRGEIAMLFGVPPHMIGDTEKATSWGSGIEQQSIGFVTYSLRPWLVSIEKRVGIDLLSKSDRRRWFAEFLVDGLLRGDAASRAQSLAIQRQNGVLNADEWREIENRNPLPNGEGQVFLVNSAMVSPAAAADSEGVK